MDAFENRHGDQETEFIHNGVYQLCPVQGCRNAMNDGGGLLYKSWHGYATEVPAEFRIVCENGCDLDHPIFCPPHSFFIEWANRTTKRLNEAFGYCDSDPNAALAKYRVIAEDSLSVLGVFLTKGSMHSKKTNENTAHGYFSRLNAWLNDKSNIPTVPFQEHSQYISAFMGGLQKLGQGVHNWENPFATSRIAHATKLEIADFLHYLVSKIIVVPYRPVDLHTDHGTLIFCENIGCSATKTLHSFIETTKEYPDDPDWVTRSPIYKCEMC